MNKFSAIVNTTLILSLTYNVYLTLAPSYSLENKFTSMTGVTPFAKLSWNKWIKFEHGGIYHDHNETLANEAWNAINIDTGSVALKDAYVAKMELPRAQRFPWDDGKGLYFVNALHQLHCLKALRRSFLELRDGQSLSWPWSHNMHCFNTLREEIMCSADDTPRYTSEDHPGESGFNQYRRCRDWNQLEDWARAHTSCWRDINGTDHIDPLLRYRYCPPGSRYAWKVHSVFGDFEEGDNANASN